MFRTQKPRLIPTEEMARPTPTTSSDSKPLPSPTILAVPQEGGSTRPGTSGTEAALKTTTRRASEKFRQAERAERAYRARKRSAATRANLTDAKDHLRQAKEHFKLGVKLLVAVAKGWPYVLREKREGRRLKAEEEKRKRVLEMKRKLDEKIAAAGGEGGEDGEGEKEK